MKIQKHLLILFLFVISLFFSGCYSFKNNYRTLGDMVTHFSQEGIKLEAIQALHPFFGADRAMSLQISGLEIGIYKYNSLIKVQETRLKKITDNGFVYVEGMKYPVLVNGTFMLLGYEKNPQKKKIVKVFNSFK